MNKLSAHYYLQEDVVALAKDLLGKKLCTNFNNLLTTGIITETEAYAGVTDKASHAYNGRRTNRTETMYATGGVAYVYLCYGIHHLFNVVTNVAGIPHAILLRAIHPANGIKTMLKRRNKTTIGKNFSAGPGTTSQALGITTIHDGLELTGNEIWIEETNLKMPENTIQTTPRIGIDYAEEDALLPYRFVLNTTV